MSDQLDLFGKTFDQQHAIAKEKITKVDIQPNRRIAGEIVFEPMLKGVRVTARDENHRVLWGFVGSKEMTSQIHCLVAIYETLQGLIDEELKKKDEPTRDYIVDPVKAANGALNNLQKTIEVLRQSIDTDKVKKAVEKGISTESVGDATKKRAAIITRLISDADKMIWLEASSLRGVKKGRTDSV